MCEKEFWLYLLAPSIGLDHNEQGRESTLRNLSIEEYRAEWEV